MTTHSLLLLPGDGIGPEVMAEVERLVAFFNKKGKVRVQDRRRRWSAAPPSTSTALPLTEEALAKARAADAIVFGAVGGPEVGQGGLRDPARGRACCACARSSTCSPTCAPPSAIRRWRRPRRLKREHVEGLDILILRELTGGTYFGEPKEIVTLENGEKRAVDTTVYTTREIERIARVAFDLARKRRNKVHSAEKRNVMKTGVLWHEVVSATHAREAKDVELQHILADACAMQLVRNPKQFDVIVCDNLFGDMLSDEAAMLTGSIGMLPSASLGAPDAKTGKRKALYEPVHGSAPDIAGKGLANPIAAIASYGMALRYSYGLVKEADLIDKADRQRAVPRLAHRRHHAAQHAQGGDRRDGQGDPGGGGEAGGCERRCHGRACPDHPPLR